MYYFSDPINNLSIYLPENLLLYFTSNFSINRKKFCAVRILWMSKKSTNMVETKVKKKKYYFKINYLHLKNAL